MENNIFIYQDRGGDSAVGDFLRGLTRRGEKRELLTVAGDTLELLQRYGTVLEEPVLRELEEDFFAVRISEERGLFFVNYQGDYVLLHPFVSSRPRPPSGEIRQARREWEDFLKRGDTDSSDDVPFSTTWSDIRHELFTVEERSMSDFRVTFRGEVMTLRQETGLSYFKMGRRYGIDQVLLEGLENGSVPLELEVAISVLAKLGKVVRIDEM